MHETGRLTAQAVLAGASLTRAQAREAGRMRMSSAAMIVPGGDVLMSWAESLGGRARRRGRECLRFVFTGAATAAGSDVDGGAWGRSKRCLRRTVQSPLARQPATPEPAVTPPVIRRARDVPLPPLAGPARAEPICTLWWLAGISAGGAQDWPVCARLRGCLPDDGCAAGVAMFLEVPLVVFLGPVERGRRGDLSDDLPFQRLLLGVT
jgi:hypothetical protein